MKILVLTAFDLFPPVHGASSLVYTFVKRASGRHEIAAVISHLYSQGGKPDLPPDRVRIQYAPPSAVDRLKVLSFWVNPAYYDTAVRTCQQAHSELVQCETLWPFLAAWRLRRRHGVPLVWVEHNVEADKFAFLGRPRPLVALVRQVERFACRHADHVITLTEADRARLISHYGLPDQRSSTITPGPDLSEFTFRLEDRDAVRAVYELMPDDALLTFVGNLRYEPNREAVRHIADRIYPAVVARHPAARFVIIGQGADRCSDYRRERLTFTGYVSRAQLVAHLCATDVFLVPVVTGAGVRVKIPEAAACGRAIVATRKALEGLEAYADDEILRTDRVDDTFIGIVLRLIEDRAWRHDVGERARVRTLREFDWDKTLAAYEHAYAQAMNAAKHRFGAV